ncbi:hypothetical protein Tco_0641740 [Tanacetum coccineum]
MEDSRALASVGGPSALLLKVSPWKGVIHFGKRGKLNPMYIGLFKVLAKVGTVAYRLELPQRLSRVHSPFHVSNLKKCLSDKPLAIPLEEIHIDDKLHFVEEPVEIRLIDLRFTLEREDKFTLALASSSLHIMLLDKSRGLSLEDKAPFKRGRL